MAKEESGSSSVPIHFLGFLVHVDDSITGLQLGDGFQIERKSQTEVMPFLSAIEKSYGDEQSIRLIAFDADGSPKGCYCVTKSDVDRFEGDVQGGMVIKWSTARTVHSQFQDKLRLVRLFKEGNVVIPYSCLYRSLPDGNPKIAGLVRSYPIWDMTPFTLEPSESEEVRAFVTNRSLPLPEEYLQLAFEGFELSYEIHDAGLAFLSLMIAMEVLLNPSDHELRYRVSRNTGVLLGLNRAEGEAVFKEMKNLYDKRSKLVHTGNRSLASRKDMLRLRQYVREAIKEALRSGMPKDALLSTLNMCGFGERPWRMNQ